MHDPKSRLQQLLQKYGEPLPEYTFEDIRIPHSNSSFHCNVTASVKGTSYNEKVGPFSNKKEAAHKAAETLLGKLEKLISDDYKVDQNLLEGVKIYIDYENYQDDGSIENFKSANNFLNIFKVCNNKHPSRDKADIHVNSQHRDATDTFIIVKAGQDLLDDEIRKIFIVSHDHFASTLDSLYSNIYHVTDIKELIDTLKQ